MEARHHIRNVHRRNGELSLTTNSDGAARLVCVA